MSQEEQVEIIYAVEGLRDPQSTRVPRNTKVGEFALMVAKLHGDTELVEVLVEDSENSLGHEAVLVDVLAESMAHVAKKDSKIKVLVEHNGKTISRDFGPSATIRTVLVWAVSPQGFNLEGKVTDFQLKYEGEVQPDDRHIGQIARGQKELSLVLVYRVKPQGC